MELWFDGITRPVRLGSGATELLPVMREIVSAWPGLKKADNHPDPVITIWRHADGFFRTSPWLDEAKAYTDPVNATCDFIVDLVHAYNADHPDILCLHCAAALINDRLVIFPNGYNQGKSTFMALLASQRIRMLCDDVMPLDLKSFEGQALGIQPRLRNPVPSGLGARFDTLVRNHTGPHSSRFQYLNLTEDFLAGFGETYPVGGVVILDRNETGENTITPASQADALKAIILRNFSDSMPAANILDGLCALIDQARTFRLSYNNGDTAVDLLRGAFD